MIKTFNGNIIEHGYIGSTALPLLVYLTLTTAILDEPVSLLIKGPASSGKSFALKCAKRYVPDDAYEQYEGMSERALLYLGDQLDLRHKTLIIQEAAGISSGIGRVFLRQLLTEGSVRYGTVQSNREGLQGYEPPSVEGPCGLIMTTTANAIHHEDESRMLSYYMEESPEHLREILRAQAIGESSTPTDNELEPFHQHYRALRDSEAKALVPFADQLVEALPVSHPRILRDFPKIISLIKAVALLHSCGRSQGDNGEFIAEIDDYRIVWELLGDTIAQGLDQSVSEGVRKVVEAVSELTSESAGDPNRFAFGSTVNLHQIAAYLGIDRSGVSRHVHGAISDDYLINDNPGQGRPAAIRMGTQPLPSGTVLPHPDDLRPPLAG